MSTFVIPHYKPIQQETAGEVFLVLLVIYLLVTAGLIVMGFGLKVALGWMAAGALGSVVVVFFATAVELGKEGKDEQVYLDSLTGHACKDLVAALASPEYSDTSRRFIRASLNRNYPGWSLDLGAMNSTTIVSRLLG